MTKIEEAITNWFGERCADFCEGCFCCEAWAEYDALRQAATPRPDCDIYVNGQKVGRGTMRGKQ